MKRIKLLFVTIAITLAIGTAFATRPCATCTYADQYIYNGAAYVYAGEFGYDYFCTSGGAICSYYKPNPIFYPNYYAPCRYGNYVLIP